MFKIFTLEMKEKKIPTGMYPLDIFIYSIVKQREKQNIEGGNGYIDNGSIYQDRPIEMDLLLRAKDTKDYRLLRDSIFDFFSNDVYVTENYQPGKRIKISVDASYIPERIRGNQQVARVSIPCEVIGLPFFESVGTTQDIQREGISTNSGLWGYGMGLIAEDASLQYSHTGASFSIYNAGNVEVHPFESYLKIIIDQVTGSTTNFTLTNQTTGDVFKVNESVNSLSEIVLDGANITINAAAALRKTNRHYISLAPGYNQFKITGATSARVRFDFRYLYK